MECLIVNEGNKKARLSDGCIQSHCMGSIHSAVPIEMYGATDLCSSSSALIKTQGQASLC